MNSANTELIWILNRWAVKNYSAYNSTERIFAYKQTLKTGIMDLQLLQPCR